MVEKVQASKRAWVHTCLCITLLAVCRWDTYLFSLSLNFLIYTMELTLSHEIIWKNVKRVLNQIMPDKHDKIHKKLPLKKNSLPSSLHKIQICN